LLIRAVEAMPCPVAAVAGADGRILAVNPAWDRTAGAEAPFGTVGKAVGDLFPAAADAAAEVIRGAGPVTRRGLPRSAGPDGVTTWWDLDLVPHPDGADVVLVIARDVTDHVLARREAEDAREALEPIGTRLRLAQEAAGIGTWEWDATTDRQAWSPEQFRLHGLDPAARQST
jgi:PAS domain-containing protein